MFALECGNVDMSEEKVRVTISFRECEGTDDIRFDCVEATVVEGCLICEMNGGVNKVFPLNNMLEVTIREI